MWNVIKSRYFSTYRIFIEMHLYYLHWRWFTHSSVGLTGHTTVLWVITMHLLKGSSIELFSTWFTHPYYQEYTWMHLFVHVLLSYTTVIWGHSKSTQEILIIFDRLKWLYPLHHCQVISRVCLNLLSASLQLLKTNYIAFLLLWLWWPLFPHLSYCTVKIYWKHWWDFNV